MKTLRIGAVLWLIILICHLSNARAQDTTFTYQGQVLDNGAPFTGTGQFQFALVTSTNANHTATATANLSAPFVTGYTLTYGGNGYVTAPAVTIFGGGGTGATATANLTGGVVTSLTPGSAGTGYTSTPTVTIAPPPANIDYTTYWSNDGTSVNGSEPAASISVAVTNGLFTVVLGNTNIPNLAAIPVSVFNQPNLQLQIWFNDGTHGFAALSPVQNLTPTPYAVYAANAASAGAVAATNIVGTLPAAQLPASVITNGASGVDITGVFSGNGAGITNVPGTLAQVVAASTSFTALANTAYDLTNSVEVSVALPTNANVGDVIQVTGAGTGGWQVTGDGLAYWTAQTTMADWQCVASSSDGTHLVAVAYDGGIYTSTNSGVTCTEQIGAPTSADWQSVASSSDGTHLVAVEFLGGIYTSANSGVTWTEQTSAPTSTNWFSVASSSDGTHLVAVVNTGQIYTSANSGMTWTEQTNPPTSPYWSSVASSSDGTHLVAVVSGGGIYTSTNSGVAWTEQTNAPTSAFWYSVASSADGTHLVAVGDPGGIYTSANSGVTWTEQASAPTSAFWSSVASSSDGTHLVAVAYSGRIYTTAFSGAAGTAEQFQYLGNGVWQPLPPTSGYLASNGSTVQSLSNVVTNGENGVTLSGTFSGNGTGLTSVSAGSLTGLISQASLGTTNSYTPTIGDGIHNFATTTQSGYYAEVGNLVYVQIWLEWNSKGSAVSTSGVQISLPVPVAVPRATFTLGYLSGLTFNNQLTATASGGLSVLSLDDLSKTGGAATGLTVSSFGTGGEIQISGVYRWQ